jgi:hypothetical protein
MSNITICGPPEFIDDSNSTQLNENSKCYYKCASPVKNEIYYILPDTTKCQPNCVVNNPSTPQSSATCTLVSSRTLSVSNIPSHTTSAAPEQSSHTPGASNIPSHTTSAAPEQSSRTPSISNSPSNSHTAPAEPEQSGRAPGTGNTPSHNHTNLAQALGITFGVILFVVLCGVLAFFTHRRPPRRKYIRRQSEDPGSESMHPTPLVDIHGNIEAWREPPRDDNAMLKLWRGIDSRVTNHILNYYVEEEPVGPRDEIIHPELFADLNSRVCNLSELLGREESRSFTLRALLVHRLMKAVEDGTLSPGIDTRPSALHINSH